MSGFKINNNFGMFRPLSYVLAMNDDVFLELIKFGMFRSLRYIYIYIYSMSSNLKV